MCGASGKKKLQELLANASTPRGDAHAQMAAVSVSPNSAALNSVETACSLLSR